MHVIKVGGIALASLVLLGGCTELITYSVKNSTSSEPPKGIVYYLPKTEFTVKTSFIITECEINSISKEISFLYEEKGEVTNKPVSDFSNAFYFNPEEHSKPTKEVSFEVEMYDNGVLKAINASLTDKSGEIIVDVAKTAGKIALYATTPEAALLEFLPDSAKMSGDSAKNKNKKRISLCGKKIDDAIKIRPTAKDKLTAAQKGLEAKIKAIKDFQSEQNTTKIPNEFADELVAARVLLSKEQDAYDLILKTLTISASKTFSDDYNVTITPPRKAFNDFNAKYIDDIQSELTRRFSVNNGSVPSSLMNEESYKGVLYRQPATVNISICKDDTDEKCKFSEDKVIPGIGVLASLPLSNGFAEKHTLAAKFTEQGALTYVKYTSNAQAQELTSTASQVADVYSEYKINKAKISQAEKQSELNDIDYQIELATKKEALKKLQAGDTTIADLEYQIKVEKLKNDLNVLTQDTTQIDQLNTQINLVTKQKELQNLLAFDQYLAKLKREKEIKTLENEIAALNNEDAIAKLETTKLLVETEEILSESKSE